MAQDKITLENLIQREIDRIDVKIEQLQEVKKAWQKSLFHARNRDDKEETGSIKIPVRIIPLEEYLSSQPLKPNQALMKLFNKEPLRHWTTIDLSLELMRMKKEKMLDSAGKNLIWIVHNGLRILDKKSPKPVLKKGKGRTAYYIKNPELM